MEFDYADARNYVLSKINMQSSDAIVREYIFEYFLKNDLVQNNEVLKSKLHEYMKKQFVVQNTDGSIITSFNFKGRKNC